jgi:hypothetical protein
VKGRNVTGEILLGLAQSYVEAINTGSVPNIESAWTYVCKAESAKLVETGVEDYSATMRALASSFPIELSVLKEAHDSAVVQIQATFRDKAMSAETETFEAELLARVNEMYKIIKKENKRACSKQCEALFSTQYQTFHDKLKSNEYTQINTFM